MNPTTICSQSLRRLSLRAPICVFFLCANFLIANCAHAIHNSIPAVHGDLSRTLLGDGTGVIIGIVDSGMDDTHPSLAGVDSLGNPRLVAEQNFTFEVGNTGDDVFGHGTWVSSAALSSDPLHLGFAPDARYVNARAIDSSNTVTPNNGRNGAGYAIDQGSHIINLSLNYPSQNDGNYTLDKMLDWAAYERGILVVTSAGNISVGDSTSTITPPASNYNGFAVGAAYLDQNRIAMFSRTGTTSNGRSKPDLVAPGTFLTLANDDWEDIPGTADDWEDQHQPGVFLNGTSFAAPHVTGLLAQWKDYGMTHGLSTSPLVAKATVMSSTVPILNKQSQVWTPGNSSNNGGVLSVTQPLNVDSGAGLIDGLRLYEQYSAGEQGPGSVAAKGWDLNTINGVSSLDYAIDELLQGGTTLTASLSWFRHIVRTDNGNGIIDSGDAFTQIESLDNLNLAILLNGQTIAESISTVDNLEFLRITLPQTGHYSIRVDRLNVSNSGSDELYGLAWYGTAAVPEPASFVLLLLIVALVGASKLWRK